MMFPYRLIWFPIVLILTLLIACSSNAPRTSATTLPEGPIHNLHLLSEGLYSGGEPPTSDHYAQLADLGIRTVVSVDAIAPDPKLAEPYGIRIVHLPIGYDGIDDQRALELAAVIKTLEHPIYVHCHHGKHRGPAALCVGAIGAGLITNDQAQEFMQTAGTSPKYTGLWNAAQSAQRIDESLIERVHDLPARAPVSNFVDAMGQVDRLHDRLWDMSEADWKTPEDHPDLSPSAVSGQIHDLLRMMLEDDIVTQEGQGMRRMMMTSINAAAQVERDINSGRFDHAIRSMDALHQSCVDCHDKYR